VLDDLGARYAVPGVKHQKFQQRKFFRSELDGALAALHAVLDAAQFEVVHAQDCLRGVASPQQCPHARGQLGKRERFEDEIVRAQIERLGALLGPRAAAQEQNGQVGALGTDAAQDFQPAGRRQVEVENRGSINPLARDAQCFFSRRREIHIEIFRGETALKKRPQCGIVLGDEKAHSCS
jgi:hypothetical protein